eukprot:CAMPEP_0206519546 /NCGR_PEP_ID=MMETSP0324_2-20121206/65264_1 /ASSEMBLY_ACC=CAM_ASM_000836 /TAXON_ID=2866 /ORGANISM="Crypthecodinium cohnii, Strain Seligo" /LENGTH=173 /DNA_ID=CAMNT_0054013165 /DNA_START=1 /DNA_END=524 /DNA_ORIENTATION=-
MAENMLSRHRLLQGRSSPIPRKGLNHFGPQVVILLNPKLRGELSETLLKTPKLRRELPGTAEPQVATKTVEDFAQDVPAGPEVATKTAGDFAQEFSADSQIGMRSAGDFREQFLLEIPFEHGWDLGSVDMAVGIVVVAVGLKRLVAQPRTPWARTHSVDAGGSWTNALAVGGS